MNQNKNESKEILGFLSITLAAIFIFSFALFGITGMRVVFGIIFMSLPVYFILNNFELEEGEKFVFSILLGLTLMPSFAYLLGLLISFRMAIVVVFIALIIAGFLVRKYKVGNAR